VWPEPGSGVAHWPLFGENGIARGLTVRVTTGLAVQYEPQIELAGQRAARIAHLIRKAYWHRGSPAV
jgi:hypothetical protein